jgi:hypothetical protein
LGGGEGGGSAGLGAWLDHASARLNGLARLFRAGLALAGHSCQATGHIRPCHAQPDRLRAGSAGTTRLVRPPAAKTKHDPQPARISDTINQSVLSCMHLARLPVPWYSLAAATQATKHASRRPSSLPNFILFDVLVFQPLCVLRCLSVSLSSRGTGLWHCGTTLLAGVLLVINMIEK